MDGLVEFKLEMGPYLESLVSIRKAEWEWHKEQRAKEVQLELLRELFGGKL